MIIEKMLIEKATTEMMKFLDNFDKDRTIGSITRKEVKTIVKDSGQIKQIMEMAKAMRKMR